jgi:hypothetical protein
MARLRSLRVTALRSVASVTSPYGRTIIEVMRASLPATELPRAQSVTSTRSGSLSLLSSPAAFQIQPRSTRPHHRSAKAIAQSSKGEKTSSLGRALAAHTKRQRLTPKHGDCYRKGPRSGRGCAVDRCDGDTSEGADGAMERARAANAPALARHEPAGAPSAASGARDARCATPSERVRVRSERGGARCKRGRARSERRAMCDEHAAVVSERARAIFKRADVACEHLAVVDARAGVAFKRAGAACICACAACIRASGS